MKILSVNFETRVIELDGDIPQDTDEFEACVEEASWPEDNLMPMGRHLLSMMNPNEDEFRLRFCDGTQLPVRLAWIEFHEVLMSYCGRLEVGFKNIFPGVTASQKYLHDLRSVTSTHT